MSGELSVHEVCESANDYYHFSDNLQHLVPLEIDLWLVSGVGGTRLIKSLSGILKWF